MNKPVLAAATACVAIFVLTSACGTLSVPKRAELVGSFAGNTWNQDDLLLCANRRFAHEFYYEGRYHVEHGTWEYDPISDPLQRMRDVPPDTISLLTAPGPPSFGYLTLTGFNDPNSVWGARAMTGTVNKCSNGDLMIEFGDSLFYRDGKQPLRSCA
jgi:hypothetical protein